MEIDGKVLETVGGKDSSRLSLKEIDGKVQSPLWLEQFHTMTESSYSSYQ